MASTALAAADGRWPEILCALADISADQLIDRHQPCPACGGDDRFRWDRDDGPGGWYCNQCGGKDGRGGGGTGIDLLLRCTGWSFAQAATAIELHLGIPSTNGHRKPSPAPRRSVIAAPSRPSRPHRQPEVPPSGHSPAAPRWCHRSVPLRARRRIDHLVLHPARRQPRRHETLPASRLARRPLAPPQRTPRRLQLRMARTPAALPPPRPGGEHRPPRDRGRG
jgi:hypothetical protein